MTKELSIVIPFYNDSGNPIPFVNSLKKELMGIDYELILVDDASKDNTPLELDSLKSSKVKVIHNQWNMDYGGAIMTGLNVATGRVIGWTCGDGEVTPKSIVEVYNQKGTWPVIKAIRKRRRDGLLRSFLSKSFSIFTDFRFRLSLLDVNGYPVYIDKEIYATLPNSRKDWLFNLDLFRRIVSKGYKIWEIPVPHRPRFKGRSHMSPKKIIKMILKYLLYR